MRPRLLIAESDSELRDLLRTFLSARGFNVASAGNGLECLEQLRCFQPEYLVLERELLWGGSDGVVATLREDDPRLPVQVVIITDDGQEFDLMPPVVSCLQKPFSMFVLLECLAVRSSGRQTRLEAGAPNRLGTASTRNRGEDRRETAIVDCRVRPLAGRVVWPVPAQKRI